MSVHLFASSLLLLEARINHGALSVHTAARISTLQFWNTATLHFFLKKI